MKSSQRADLDATVMGLSTRLLGVGNDDLGPTVRESLADLCRVFSLDRSYVVKASMTTQTQELYEEWWASDVPGTSTPIPSLPREAQRFWRDTLRAGEVVHVPDLEADPPEGVDGLAAAAQRGIERMARLIDDLLEYALAGRPMTEPVPVDLREVAADVVADLTHDLERAGVRCTVGKLPTVPGEPTQLRQLVQNLVGN